MSTSTIVIIVVAVAAAALIGVLTLAALSAGEKGPRRFSLSAPADTARFIDRDAAWAATVEFDVRRSVDAAWQQILDGPIVSIGPVLNGPTVVGVTRTYHGIIAATAEVVEQSNRSSITTLGSAISIPVVVKSFAERLTVAPVNESSSRVTYSLAIQPRFIGFLPLRWTAVFVRPVITFFLKSEF
ncbi:hypothetical protein JVX90_02785 [Gordonia sp. PDNC005]|uniref:hypothetical protein n=1 Tax=unclassified Gordonia (in: high G+C Gram-positive bacteria) TaxID=2657482 RepID=UPI00196666A6|nr:hypothetical protein [Gordonia sp. PDNC005]QRY63188.1 hypothetical protein JVX90_02785 [Gordonia sp. PDNC005]